MSGSISKLLTGTLAVASLACTTTSACAGEDPYVLGLGLSAGHDSNVLRTIEPLPSSVTTMTARAGVDQPIGRQRLHGSASFDDNRFDRLSYLNNHSYKADLGLDWEAGHQWFGEVGADTQQQLYRYDTSLVGTFTGRNMERADHAFLHARTGVVTRWTFEGVLDALQRTDSDPLFGFREVHSNTAQAGMGYQHTPDLGGRVLLRLNKGTYPKLGTGDDFTREGVDTSVAWNVTGASKFDGRLSWTHGSDSLPTARAPSYWSGSLAWIWQPTGKVTLTNTLSRDRDTGANSMSTGGTGSTPFSDARMRTAYDLGATWLATGLIQVNAKASFARRTLDSSYIDLGIYRTSADSLTQFTLGVLYKPTRSLDLGCSLNFERRRVDGDGAGLSYPYQDRSGQCYGQWAWRG